MNCGCFGKFKCDEHYQGVFQQGKCTLWPRESDAAGVQPWQREEAIAAAAKRGVKIDFNPATGAARFETKQHEKRYLEQVRGLHLCGKGGGYGDAAPQKHDEEGFVIKGKW